VLRTRNTLIRTGLACLLLALGVAVFQAPLASAAPSCEGGPINGQGSTLQAIAQEELWASATGGYNAKCGEKQVQYRRSSDRVGLESWGFVGASPAFEKSWSFVSTDAAPGASQISSAKGASGSSILTIPVGQTALAVVVNPPSACKITEILNKQLEAVMAGTIKIWNKLSTAEGEGCVNAPITRVVPTEGSGTAYQAKNYLAKISEASLTCLPTGLATTTWNTIDEISAKPSEELNTLWPENSVASGCTTEVSAIARGEGDRGVVRKANVTEGSIGFAALPAVETYKNQGENPNGDTNWIKVQDNGVSTNLGVAKFASPLEAGKSANCFEAQYPVPASAQVGATNPANADWSQIFGSNTNAAAASPGAYSICALTYVESLTEYSKAGFSLAAETTAKDYIANYLTAVEGQEALEIGGKWYTPLPEGTKSFNVLGAAQYAAGKIGY
jgi:ABC-type phosphate transport system substrate-binding protein